MFVAYLSKKRPFLISFNLGSGGCCGKKEKHQEFEARKRKQQRGKNCSRISDQQSGTKGPAHEIVREGIVNTANRTRKTAGMDQAEKGCASLRCSKAATPLAKGAPSNEFAKHSTHAFVGWSPSEPRPKGKRPSGIFNDTSRTYRHLAKWSSLTAAGTTVLWLSM